MLLIIWVDLKHDVNKIPLSFIKIILYLGIYAYKYSIGTLKVATLCPSCTSKMSVQNRAPGYNGGNEMLSP